MIENKFLNNIFQLQSYDFIGEQTMIKKIVSLIKKVVFAFLVLYGLNLFVNSFNVMIPINVFTIGTVTFLGVPGLVSLVVMFFMTK